MGRCLERVTVTRHRSGTAQNIPKLAVAVDTGHIICQLSVTALFVLIVHRHIRRAVQVDLQRAGWISMLLLERL